MVAEFIKVGKIKIQLSFCETQIKNLCVNDPEYIGNLLDDPAAALLQVGIDVKDILILVKISVRRDTSELFFNFFVGVNAWRELREFGVNGWRESPEFKEELPDLLLSAPFTRSLPNLGMPANAGLLDSANSYIGETIHIETIATRSIIFKNYGIKDKKLLSPKEASKIRDEKKAEWEEATGETFLKSTRFQSAFLCYIDSDDFDVGEYDELEEFGLNFSLIQKEVGIRNIDDRFGFLPPVEWGDLSDLFEENGAYADTTNEYQSLTKESFEEKDKIILEIISIYELKTDDDIDPKITIYNHRYGEFKFNDTRSGLKLDKYYKEIDGSDEGGTRASFSPLSTSTREKLESFVKHFNDDCFN